MLPEVIGGPGGCLGAAMIMIAGGRWWLSNGADK